MMKAKLYPNLISFKTVRRGEWILKVSVFKSKHVLLFAQHFYDQDVIIFKHFDKHESAAEFIDKLVIEE